MKTLALIIDGKIQATRTVNGPAAVQLERKGWREILETTKPEAGNTFRDVVTGGAVEVVGGIPTRVWAVSQRPNKERKDLVDAGCQAWIESIFTPAKQRNWIARNSELLEKRIDGETLTAAEKAEVATIKSGWAWVKDCRREAARVRQDPAATPVWPAPSEALAAALAA